MSAALCQSPVILPRITRCLSPPTLFYGPLLRSSNKIRLVSSVYFDSIPSYLLTDLLVHQAALISVFPSFPSVFRHVQYLIFFHFKKKTKLVMSIPPSSYLYPHSHFSSRSHISFLKKLPILCLYLGSHLFLQLTAIRLFLSLCLQDRYRQGY